MTATPEIERAAQAAMKASWLSGNWEAALTAALETLAEPTEAMVEAAGNAICNYDGAMQQDLAASLARAALRAGIRATLGRTG